MNFDQIKSMTEATHYRSCCIFSLAFHLSSATSRINPNKIRFRNSERRAYRKFVARWNLCVLALEGWPGLDEIRKFVALARSRPPISRRYEERRRMKTKVVGNSRSESIKYGRIGRVSVIILYRGSAKYLPIKVGSHVKVYSYGCRGVHIRSVPQRCTSPQRAGLSEIETRRRNRCDYAEAERFMKGRKNAN